MELIEQCRDVPVIFLGYVRVSSVSQVRKGDGLNSQETRCREYARMKGYKITKFYRDEGVSGSVVNRPSMKQMLADAKSLRAKHPDAEIIICVDDISRISRGLEAHLEIRAAISAIDVKLESPSIEFGETSDAKLVEHLLASVAQHQREKNGEQTKHRMRARLMNGYWTFITPVGWKTELRIGEGKVLVRDEPIASILTEALNGYASGHFRTMAEVKRFLESQPAFPKNKKGHVRNQKVKDILTNPLYAGYVQKAEWGISLRKGRHEGLIDFETFERIQRRLTEKAQTPARADINRDFPLRGTISCACCGGPLTANWAKSKTGKRHPYYMCFKKGCERHGKSIRRDVIEGEFQLLLDNMTPNKPLFEMIYDMLKDIWEQRTAQTQAITDSAKKKVTKLESQIEGLMDRIVVAENNTVVSAYEKRIENSNARKFCSLKRFRKSVNRNAVLRSCSNSPCDSSQTLQNYGVLASLSFKNWC